MTLAKTPVPFSHIHILKLPQILSWRIPKQFQNNGSSLIMRCLFYSCQLFQNVHFTVYLAKFFYPIILGPVLLLWFSWTQNNTTEFKFAVYLYVRIHDLTIRQRLCRNLHAWLHTQGISKFQAPPSFASLNMHHMDGLLQCMDRKLSMQQKITHPFLQTSNYQSSSHFQYLSVLCKGCWPHNSICT